MEQNEQNRGHAKKAVKKKFSYSFVFVQDPMGLEPNQ